MIILFLERSLGRGGAQRQLVTLATELSRRGHRVTVVLFYNEGSLIDDLKSADVKLRYLEKKKRWHLFGFLLSTLRALRAENPDVICTFLPVPNLIAAVCSPFLSGTPLVWGIRASNVDLARYDCLTRLSYRIEALCSRIPDSVISNSKAGRGVAIASGFPRKKLVVVPNGIDTNRFKPDNAGREAWRREWAVERGDIVVGLVGRLDPMKDHQTFIRAAALVSSSLTNARFVCVGDDGPVSRRDLVEFAASLGLHDRMIWLPGQDDVPAILSACDVVCSSSAYGEGFSNVLGEAMACGRRCVATDVGDACDIIGETGCIVPSRNVEQLAHGIEQLCRVVMQKGEDCAEARERINRLFSVEVMVSRFESEFGRVTRRRE